MALATGFGGFNQANQAALLQQQVNDQLQAQNILRQISATKAQYQNPVPSYQAPTQAPSTIQSYQQMAQMMMIMMAMMQSMAQLGGGFSSFLGGPQQPQYPTHGY
jgi:hypothetical protein